MNLKAENLNKYLIEKLPDEVFYIPNYLSKQDEEDLLGNIYSTSEAKWTQLSKRRLQNWGGIPHKKGMIAENIPRWLGRHCEGLKDIFNGTSPNHVLINEYKPGQGIMPHKDGPLYFPTVGIISLQGNCLMHFYKALHSPAATAAVCECGKESSVDGKQDEKNSEADDNVDENSAFRFEGEKMSLEERELGALYLERRSLLVFRAGMYETHLHGIKECMEDEMDEKVANRKEGHASLIERSSIRVSLTIRVVPKTLKASRIFGKIK